MEKSIGELLAAFEFGVLQEALTIYDWLEKKGKTIDDLREYVDLVKKVTKIIVKRQPMKICPDCSHPMTIHPGDHPDNSIWACNKCRFSEYVPRSMQDEVARILREREVRNGLHTD